MKNFDIWNSIKKYSEINFTFKYYKPRQIWWMMLGCNMGHEQDGKGEYFERPVLILTKFNNRLFFGIPLSTKIKNNPFYIKIKDNHGRIHCAIISQLRLLDASRLREKMGFIDKINFKQIKKAIKRII
jgi:mRNA interferase MazF